MVLFLWNRAFLLCGFFFLLLSFSSPNLSRRRLDVCHTSTHGVALVRISNASLKCTARGSLEMQNAKKSLKYRHLGTITQLCRAISSHLRHMSTIGKKNLLSSNISFTRPHNMVNSSLLAAESVSFVWGTPANFNGFRVLASLLQQRRSTEANQTLHNVCPLPGMVDYMYTLSAAVAP